MPFRSVSSPPVAFVSPTGSGEKSVYQVQLTATGHKQVVMTGKTNLYARIQASLEDSKVENIIRRFTAGDTSALQSVQGRFLDATSFPQSFAEMQNMVARVYSEFETLPLEVRAKFDHSPERYMAAYGSEDWADALGLKKTSSVLPEQPLEVKLDADVE